MYKIKDAEIEFILADITKRGVVTEDVRMNILDHVCCIIENEIGIDQDFYALYQQTIQTFYHKELSEIQDETNLLLTFKNYYAMKRTLKISGILTIILIMMGVLFKTMHWPGAGILIVLSLTSFSLVFIPLNIVLKFKDDQESGNRIIMTLGLLTAAASTIGVLFKIMHWPYANKIMFGSLLVFMFIPVYFIIKYRSPESKFNAIINTTFMVGAAGMLFALINLGHSKKHIEQENEHELKHQHIDKPISFLSKDYKTVNITY